MNAGFVGLGRMGGAMVQRLLAGDHQVSVYDRDQKRTAEIGELGARPQESLQALVKDLPSPKVVWVMVPAGEATEHTISTLGSLMGEGDIIIDGGNSFWKDSQRRAIELKKQGIDFIDAGTSGGVWGLELGYCLMVGASESAFKIAEPWIKTLAPEDGYARVGPVGAGHFAKMVHNGIEYGMLEAYAEGFEILNEASFSFDLHQVSALWNHASVVRSWLLELAEDAFAKDPKLTALKGYVEDSGEGRWTVLAAIEENVPAPVITASLMARFRSRQEESFSAKVIAALRNEFGGHAVKGV